MSIVKIARRKKNKNKKIFLVLERKQQFVCFNYSGKSFVTLIFCFFYKSYDCNICFYPRMSGEKRSLMIFQLLKKIWIQQCQVFRLTDRIQFIIFKTCDHDTKKEKFLCSSHSYIWGGILRLIHKTEFFSSCMFLFVLCTIDCFFIFLFWDEFL